MTLNTARIEKLATNALERALMRCKYLDPHIDSNDRTPVWDGQIFVYSDETGKKRKLLGQVPIQVKGTCKEDLSKEEISYQADIADLRAYYRDGGAVYFVVYIGDNGESYRIYYKTILPFDFYDVVEKKADGTHTLHLRVFPEHDPNEMMNIMVGFLQDRPKQMPIIENGIQSLRDLEKSGVKIEDVSFSIPGYGIKKENLEAYISTQEFYIYARPHGMNVVLPVEKVRDSFISRTVNAPISIKGRVYYDKYEVVYHKGEACLRIGTSLEMSGFLNPDAHKARFRHRGMLGQRIHDLSFFMEMMKHKELTINGVTIECPELKDDDLPKLQSLFDHLVEIQKMLDALSVLEELDCDKLTDKDQENINNFIGAVLHERHIRLGDITNPVAFGIFRIANLSILIWATRDERGYYSIKNFKDGRPVIFVPHGEEKERHELISHYALLQAEQYEHASNFDHDAAYDSFIGVIPSQEYLSKVNNSVLEMLKAYDAQKRKNVNLLCLVEKLCDWMYENEHPDERDFVLLNKLQAIKRQRTFSFDEYAELYRIRSSVNPYWRCGACILLEDFAEVRAILNSMPIDEDKAYFMSLPIFSFMKNSIK